MRQQAQSFVGWVSVAKPVLALGFVPQPNRPCFIFNAAHLAHFVF